MQLVLNKVHYVVISMELSLVNFRKMHASQNLLKESKRKLENARNCKSKGGDISARKSTTVYEYGRTSLSNKIATSKCTKVKNGNASFKVPSNSRIAMSC